jgi:hypothetical protein
LNSTRNRPSRRLQIAAVVVLAIGAALTVFIPPLNKASRARQLYEDAWFGDFDRYSEKSVRLLEVALRLAPGNSLYEQALVWNYPSNELPQLMKERKLGPDATRLTYGLIYTPMHRPFDVPNSGRPESPLAQALKLSRLDSRNSIARYYAAGCLVKAKRLQDAYASVQVGNRLGKGRFYEPEMTEFVSDSMAMVSDRIDERGGSMRAVVRDAAGGLAELGNLRLRAGDVEGASEIFEACCRMGVNCALSGRLTEGRSIFKIGWKSLRPVCKDFGMKEKLAEYSSLDKEFDRANRVIRKSLRTDFAAFVRGSLAIACIVCVPVFGVLGMMIVAGLLGLWSGICKTIALRGGQQLLEIVPWDEGWLTRLLLAAHLPIFCLLMVLVVVAWAHAPQKNDLVYLGFVIAFGLVIELFVVGVMQNKLRRSFNESTCERLGVLRFTFLGPASRQAWSSEWLMDGIRALVAFLVCVGLLVIILFKPVFGFHPWQYQRIPYTSARQKATMMDRINLDLEKACPASWHIGR